LLVCHPDGGEKQSATRNQQFYFSTVEPNQGAGTKKLWPVDRGPSTKWYFLLNSAANKSFTQSLTINQTI
jgi:hypothetical protein